MAVKYLVWHFRNQVKILETVLFKGNFREINRIIMLSLSYYHMLLDTIPVFGMGGFPPCQTGTGADRCGEGVDLSHCQSAEGSSD